MFKRFFHASMVFVSLAGFIGLSFELAFTDMSIDRQALVGSILVLQTIAMLMIAVGYFLQRRNAALMSEPARPHRARKKRMMPL